ncbi:nuclear transport factor 2 family protein [Pseudomonas syringae pv. coryli]|uniref:SnoaL-like domain-containing protein n=1 Tax=Pseudomonas syringae pv. coryli TaxID=317659 RepID=A0A0P9N0C9_9PSED|nr:nuclear transport factor 2 family protein [Pseudomonas syringae pv. coryli]KPW98344.1 Uncharacterized protein ALO75_00145 [Pseudomonas syringae pv. coryli]
MNITRYPVIEAYFASEAGTAVDVLEDLFTHDARVIDEGLTVSGVEAIKAWKQAAKHKYQYTVEPVESLESDGLVIVKARLDGTFPGSPAVVRFRFTLTHGLISALEIG